MRPLVAAKIGSRKHLHLIRMGYRTHHTDNGITWMEHGQGKRLPKG